MIRHFQDPPRNAKAKISQTKIDPETIAPAPNGLDQRSGPAQQGAPEPTQSSIAELFTIGELARICGVTPRALGFYEQRGMLRPCRKGAARLYDANQKARLQMILKGKQIGFTLTEIPDLLDASPGQIAEDALTLDERTVASQLQHPEETRADLDHAIAEVRATPARMGGLSS